MATWCETIVAEQLMALLAQFEIGVSRRAHDLLEIHETDPQDKSDST
jgi:hypothetical protein